MHDLFPVDAGPRFEQLATQIGAHLRPIDDTPEAFAKGRDSLSLDQAGEEVLGVGQRLGDVVDPRRLAAGVLAVLQERDLLRDLAIEPGQVAVGVRVGLALETVAAED